MRGLAFAVIEGVAVFCLAVPAGGRQPPGYVERAASVEQLDRFVLSKLHVAA